MKVTIEKLFKPLLGILNVKLESTVEHGILCYTLKGAVPDFLAFSYKRLVSSLIIHEISTMDHIHAASCTPKS